jgi:DNA-binding transcriptional LysR family regulator
LHIAAMPAIGLGFLPAAIQEFKGTHPDVTITAEVNISARVEESVAAQHVDFGIGAFPFHRTGLEAELFSRAPECLVVPAGHPLAGRATARPADLEGLPFIAFTRDQVGRHVADRVFEQAGVTRRIVAETQVNAVVCDLVRLGVGVGLVDPFTAADYADRGVVALRFRPHIEIRVGILYPVHRPLSRVARVFLSVLRRRRNALLRAGQQR